ncbi:hypothetical protein [Treponema sp. R8-4-B8]
MSHNRTVAVRRQKAARQLQPERYATFTLKLGGKYFPKIAY